MAYGAAAAHGDHDHHPTGWRRWVYSTNHKDIGTMYIWLSFIAALVGGAMSWYIRLELAHPGIQYIDDFQFYNVLVTAHGNSLRALRKHLEDISDEDIAGLNIPTGVPRRLDFDERLRLLASEDLGDPEAIAAAAAAVAAQAGTT